MSDWSSFEGDKEFADAWRVFLNEKEEKPKKSRAVKAAELILEKGGFAAGLAKMKGFRMPGKDPRGSAAKRALKMARGISFATAATGAAGAAAPEEVHKPKVTPKYTPGAQVIYRLVTQLKAGEKNIEVDPDNVKEAYNSMTDEEKEMFSDAYDKLDPSIQDYLAHQLGDVLGEQLDLSLEELIKEELLRVINEEE